MVDFINEVEEELRKDDYNKFLRKYGPFLLGLIIAIVLIAAYFEFTKSRNDRNARSVSAAYVEASELAADGDVDEAVRRFTAIAEKSPNGYAGLSYMRAAALQLDKGEALDAVRLFDQAADVFEKPRHADLARLKASYVLVGQGRYDDARTRLIPMSQKDAPYEYLSRELLALTLKETGDVSGAKAEYSYLENIPGVPPTVQARAKQAMTIIRVAENLAAPTEIDTTKTDELSTAIPSDEEPVEETGDE
ncbi:MAG: tetratricopeptide repeat protein [Maricaulaceae bacterium]